MSAISSALELSCGLNGIVLAIRRTGPWPRRGEVAKRKVALVGRQCEAVRAQKGERREAVQREKRAFMREAV